MEGTSLPSPGCLLVVGVRHPILHHPALECHVGRRGYMRGKNGDEDRCSERHWVQVCSSSCSADTLQGESSTCLLPTLTCALWPSKTPTDSIVTMRPPQYQWRNSSTSTVGECPKNNTFAVPTLPRLDELTATSWDATPQWHTPSYPTRQVVLAAAMTQPLFFTSWGTTGLDRCRTRPRRCCTSHPARSGRSPPCPSWSPSCSSSCSTGHR